jgi:hypothetical protein
VERKKRARTPKVAEESAQSEPQTQRTPKVAEESAQSEPQTPFDDPPSAPPAGNPDHSRVPSPPKRLLGARELMEYWHSVPEPERSAWFIAYVYRKYPFCDVYQPFSKEELLVFQQHKGKKRIPYNGKILERPDSNCGSLSQPLDPDNWEQQVYERWGAGDYQIRLNDQHESVHETVTECHIRNLRDWDKYAPVLNLNTVVLADEGNQPYIRWARLKGIKFPGDPDSEPQAAEEQGDDMAAAGPIVQDALKHAERMTDKVLEMANDRRQQAPAPQVDATARAQLGAVETVVEGARQAFGVMGGAMKTIIDNQVKAADPQAQMDQAVKIAELIAGKGGGGSSDVLAMMRLQLESQERNAQRQLEQQEKSFTRLIESERTFHKESIDMLKGRLDTLERKPANAGDFAPGTQGAAIEEFFKLRKKMREFDEEEGIGGSEESGPAWLGPVLAFGEKALGGVNEFMRNAAAMRANQPPAAPTVEQSQPALPAAQQAPVDQEQEVRRQAAIQIHPDLVAAIKSGARGYDFGAAVVTNAGQGAYDYVAKGGYDGVLKLLQAHPPLWQELLSPAIGGTATEKFIAEFLDKDKVMESIQMVRGQPVRKGPVVNQ